MILPHVHFVETWFIFCSVAKSCLILFDPLDCSSPDFPVLHHLPEFTQTYVCWVIDAIQSAHALLSPSPSAFNVSQHQGLFQWVSSSNQVARGLQLQLQHQSSSEYSGLIFFRIDWFDLLAVQGSLKSPALQIKSINSLVLSLLYDPTLASVHDCRFISHLFAIWIDSAHVQFSSVAQSCLTLCNPMNRSMLGLPVHHQFSESTQTHVHWIGDAIQSSHPLLSPSPPALNLSQHQGLLKWVSCSHQVAKYWSFSFSISPSNEHPGLISFRMDWLDLLAVQGTLKSLLQHHSSKASK